MTTASIRSRAVAFSAAAAGLALSAGALGAGASMASAGTLPACSPSQLAVTTANQQSAMGQRQFTYYVENTSSEACLVHDAPAVTQSNGVDVITSVGDTYFTKNTPAAWVRLLPGASATGEVSWSVPTNPGTDAYSIGINLPDVGQLDTGFRDSTGANEGFAVTNLRLAGHDGN